MTQKMMRTNGWMTGGPESDDDCGGAKRTAAGLVGAEVVKAATALLILRVDRVSKRSPGEVAMFLCLTTEKRNEQTLQLAFCICRAPAWFNLQNSVFARSPLPPNSVFRSFRSAISIRSVLIGW